MAEDITLQLQNIFFSKDTIATCNKSLLSQGNLNNISRESKQEVINLLVKNMKMVYRSIDINRINKNNFNSIYEQFKKNSINETLNEVKKTKNNIIENNDSKFQRDFNSIPTNGNQLMERPNATKTNTFPQKKEQNNFDSTLDKVFKPIVDIKPEENLFNNYSNNRGKDINSRMEEIQNMRQNEVNGQHNRPKTPDFLKSKPTNPDKIDKQNNNFNNRKDKDFVELVNDTGGDLFNIDNIDRPLIDAEIVEDSTPFEDRLKRLQSERDNVTIQPSQNQIDFTSDTFQTNNNISDNSFQSNNNIQQQQVRQQQIQERSPQERQQQERQQQERQQQERQQMHERQQQIQQIQERQQQMQERQMQQQLQQQEKIPEKTIIRTSQNNLSSLQTSKSSSKLEEIKNSMKSVNIPLREDIQKIERLERENSNLQQMLVDLQNSKNEELENIKKSISLEFEELRKKEELINSKENDISYKETFINNREEELKKLIKRHEDLMKIKQVQLEVNNDKNISEYTFNLGNNNYNVIGIKLISYHLPVTKYNIENYNNKIEYKIDDEIKSIEIQNGKYTIEELLNKLKNEDLEFILNTEQTITIKSDKEFILLNTELLNVNLGFNKKEEENKDNTFHSDRVYDLRIDDKIYLHLTNLSEEPFGILYSNGLSVCNFQFENPYKLSKLDVVFKNSKGYLYNFYGLSHNMSFILDII